MQMTSTFQPSMCAGGNEVWNEVSLIQVTYANKLEMLAQLGESG